MEACWYGSSHLALERRSRKRAHHSLGDLSEASWSLPWSICLNLVVFCLRRRLYTLVLSLICWPRWKDGLLWNCTLSLWTSCLRDLRDWLYHFFDAFCLVGRAPFFRNCTACLVSSRRRLEKSWTRVSMLGSSTLALASRSWICRVKAGEDKRSLRRSTASAVQLNLRRGDGVVLVGCGRGLYRAKSISMTRREWSDMIESWRGTCEMEKTHVWRAVIPWTLLHGSDFNTIVVLLKKPWITHSGDGLQENPWHWNTVNIWDNKPVNGCDVYLRSYQLPIKIYLFTLLRHMCTKHRFKNKYWQQRK